MEKRIDVIIDIRGKYYGRADYLRQIYLNYPCEDREDYIAYIEDRYYWYRDKLIDLCLNNYACVHWLFAFSVNTQPLIDNIVSLRDFLEECDCLFMKSVHKPEKTDYELAYNCSLICAVLDKVYDHLLCTIQKAGRCIKH